MLGGSKLSQPSAIVIAGAGAVVLTCITISVSGMRPLGEAEMLAQIKQEDSALCTKFGMPAETQRFLDCMSDLARLRNRHVQMVAAYDLP